MTESPQRRLYLVLKDSGPMTWNDIKARMGVDGRLPGSVYDAMDALIAKGSVHYLGTQRKRSFWWKEGSPEPRQVKKGKGCNPKSWENLKLGSPANALRRLRYKPIEYFGIGKIALEECWPL